MIQKLRNPFLLTGFRGKKYFCDRGGEIKTLREHFSNERNVVIYSWRRMGKTALIKYFHSIIEKSTKTETVYVDLLGSRDMPSALRLITQAVYDRFGRTSSGISDSFQKLMGAIGIELKFDPVSGVPVFSLGYKDQSVPERSLDAIGLFLEGRKKQVLITLDEFQQITSYSDGNGEAVFRSWMQSYPSIRFIYSGSHRNMMLSMFSEKNRPFYRSTQLLQLNPINLDQYSKFIKKNFEDHGKLIDDETIVSIYSWSRKQTYCIQLVCNKLFGMYDKVKIEYLSEIFKDILDQESPLFSGYTKLLTDLQWKVVQAVAKEEPLSNPFSREFIDKYNLGAASSVSTAIKSLQKNEIIIEDDGRYLIHDVLLSRWLQML